MEKVDSKSQDILKERIREFKMIFPECVSDGKINVEELRKIIGDEIDESEEKYGFTWNGKLNSIKLSQLQSANTLLPLKNKSSEWNKTGNIYIEGDNLEVLKILQKSYNRKIKVIYIDPPYNTGNDFVYNDSFEETIENYKEQTNQNNKANPETSGRFHTEWLNMMYPRLRLAKNLLTDDGVIFISIGQTEVANLTEICNQIFGENNKVSCLTRVMKSGGAQGQYFSPNIEYILVYAKNINELKYFREPISEEIIQKLYTSIETEGKRKGEKYRPFGLYQASLDPMRGCINQRYYIEAPDGTLLIPPGNVFPELDEDGASVIPKTQSDKVWRWSKERYLEEKAKGNICFKPSNKTLMDSNGNWAKWNVYSKIWLSDRQEDGMLPVDLITKWENRISKKELADLEINFDFAKPVSLIEYLITIVDNTEEAIILDFFSGSATTGHAVMKMNSSDGGHRKYILVQLPEKYDGEFDTICDLGEERIRRAGKKIKEENGLLAQDLDVGFKVFKLDSSNIKLWNGENIDINNANEYFYEHMDPIVEGRTEEDLLYEILLKEGMMLSSPIEEKIINEKKVYSVGMGYMIVCLNDDIDIELVREIGKLNPETVIFKDSGFVDENAKANALQELKKMGIEEEKVKSI